MFKQIKSFIFGNFKKTAFTLAETLLVTAILGVVAVLVVPSISKSTDVDKNLILIKSTYGTIESGLSSFFNDYGTVKELKDSGYTDANIQDLLIQNMNKYLKITQSCKNNELNNCLHTTTTKNLNNNNAFSGSSLSTFIKNNNGVAFELQNGAAFAITVKNDNYYVCFDTNGLQAPNQSGIDTFCTYYDPERGALDSNMNIDGSTNKNFEHNYISYLAWILAFDNMDYIKCAGNLNWHTKHSCN